MLRSILLIAMLCIASIISYANDPDNYTIDAIRIEQKITIDGKLDEEAWANAKSVTDFITWAPNPGKQPQNQTLVKMMYDDDAFYVGAYIKENNRKDISVQVTQRDQLGNSDWFGLIIDTYGNAQDASEFILGSSGVQFDARLANNEDPNWDAVWFSAVSLGEDGWYAEMKIPYAAIRFPKADHQEWKINFIRKVNRLNERSSWFPIDPEAAVWLNNMGKTSGIKDIKPPLRLSISPYASIYAQNYSHPAEGINSTGYSYNGGMDLKYGINDAFTLDMTLIPDFGQVQSDDQILNLSPFEVQFDERRQFFTEGTELFNKGNLFYSRRIGGTPKGYYDVQQKLKPGQEIISNPLNAKLLNATKVSGRNKKGLGIGAFNAVSNASYATVRDLETGAETQIQTAPVSNFNVLVFDQNLKNNSSVSLVNTNVTRFGNTFYDANVTGVQFNLKSKGQKYALSGEGALSQKYYADQEDQFGSKYNLSLAKISGNIYAEVVYDQVGQMFDPNDLGFQTFGNYRQASLFAVWRQFDEFGAFNRGNFWFNYNYSRIIDPNAYSEMHFNTGFWMQTKNFIELNLWSNFEPVTYDFFEPRIWGRKYKETPWANVGVYMNSDNRKKNVVRGYIDFRNFFSPGRFSYSVYMAPEFQLSDKLGLEFEMEYNKAFNDPRFVSILNDEDVIFGDRTRSTLVNSVRANFAFTDKMSSDLRVRHYWSKVTYDQFHLLAEDGTLANTDYNEFNNFSFGLLNVDLNFRWRFAPGSDLILNWKNNISGTLSNQQVDYLKRTYVEDLKNLRDFPENNSVSMRVIYYLDYQQTVNSFKMK